MPGKYLSQPCVILLTTAIAPSCDGQPLYRTGTSNASMTIISVQYLRAVAAMSVVLYHVNLQITRMGHDGPWPEFLSAGVDLFFVISGYIMWSTTAGKNVQPVVFWKRRILRIVPIYWLFTTIVLGVALLAPGLLQTSKFDLLHTIASYLFIPYPSPVDGKMVPLLIPGWTLNYEMFFYVIFGTILFLPAPIRLVSISAVLLFLAAIPAFVSVHSPMLRFWLSPIILEFLIGILVAAAASLFNIPAKTALSIAGVGLVLLLPSVFHWENVTPLSRFMLVGLPMGIILWGVVIFETSKGVSNIEPLKLLGDASYSLYLVHPLVLSALSQIWRKIFIAGGGAVISFCIVSPIICAIAAVIAYRVIERPLTTFLQRYLFLRASPLTV
jgi:peptidoglycan/LPS O-acetylase OafA/YrhL